MGTTNFDTVTVTGALQVSGTNVITARGTSPAWVNSDAPNINTRLNALIATLTTVGIIA